MADLEALGLKPRFFAYPFGEVSGDSLDAVREGGFVAAFGIEARWISRDSPRFDLPRVVDCRRTDRGWRFRLKTSAPTLYNWTHGSDAAGRLRQAEVLGFASETADAWRELHAKRFSELAFDCGRAADPGICFSEELRDWSDKATTPDQRRMELYIDRYDLRRKAHTSHRNRQFGPRPALSRRAKEILGTTIDDPEIKAAQSLDLPRYRHRRHNKYSGAKRRHRRHLRLHPRQQPHEPMLLHPASRRPVRSLCQKAGARRAGRHRPSGPGVGARRFQSPMEFQLRRLRCCCGARWGSLPTGRTGTVYFCRGRHPARQHWSRCRGTCCDALQPCPDVLPRACCG